MRFKAEAGKFRLFGVCFLPCVPLGWDAVVCSVAALLHSWNPGLFLSFSLSLCLSCTHGHMCMYYTNTHPTLLPNLLQKGLFTWLLDRHVSRTGYSLVEEPRERPDQWEYRYRHPASPGQPSPCGMDLYLPTCERLFAKLGILFLKVIIRILMIKQGTLGQDGMIRAHRDIWF